jgi:threonyl-tRNA synthetase
MVHRALFGSAERFFAMLVEHYAGAFPLWRAPTQVSVVPITDAQLPYAQAVATDLKRAGVRVAVNEGDSRVSGKIREAQIEKIPYVLVVGKREVEGATVSVRGREAGDVGPMTLAAFLDMTREARELGTATAI